HTEYGRAQAFSPALNRLVIATTALRDTAIQDVAAQLSTSFQRRFPVEIRFWSDIEDLLGSHSRIASRYYPEHFASSNCLDEGSDGELRIAMTLPNWHERIGLFFSHADFTGVAGNRLYSIRAIVSELIDNALAQDKGQATRVTIELSGNRLQLRDDGQVFDAMTSPVE